MKASIIIPTYNRKNLLEKCLNSLYEQDFNFKDFEIIIVDDGSIDGTEKVIRKHKKKNVLNIKYLKQENKGPASARNKGIAKAQGEVLIFIDDDIMPFNDLISKHYSAHKEKKNALILGNFFWHPEIVDKANKKFMNIIRSDILCCYSLMQDKRILPWYLCYSMNMSVKKKDLGKERFDEKTFRENSVEDIELAYRLVKKGLRPYYYGKINSYHYKSYDKNSLRKQAIKTGKNLFYLYLKHKELGNNIRIPQIKTSDKNLLASYIYYINEGLKLGFKEFTNNNKDRLNLQDYFPNIYKENMFLNIKKSFITKFPQLYLFSRRLFYRTGLNLLFTK
jgi:glycosyltransferase involved in cell wall biosynthesis